MRLLAISDLHLRQAENRRAVEALPAHPQDWLILGGDLGETVEELEWALDTLAPRFARLIWVPGNHDLWTLPSRTGMPRGHAKYAQLVAACQRRGVLTPEDPYPTFPTPEGPVILAPLFLLYDYSFRPPEVDAAHALDWALEEGILCTDEALLHPDPFPTRQAWCAARVLETRARLDALPPDSRTVLINHWPLREEHAWLPRVPRFKLWCGTKQTEDWHLRYRARAVVYGHLHIRRSFQRDGVRFCEVSLGHPGQWAPELGLEAHLTQVL